MYYFIVVRITTGRHESKSTSSDFAIGKYNQMTKLSVFCSISSKDSLLYRTSLHRPNEIINHGLRLGSKPAIF